MTLADHLRPPGAGDPTAVAYKDWLHLNLFDHDRGRTGLINLSLHGAPRAASSLAVGAALVEDPHAGWVGNVIVRSRADSAVRETSIALDDAALALEPTSGRLLASVRRAEDGLVVTAAARPATQPFAAERPHPFGSGWIGWRVVPRLELSGTADVLDTAIDLSGWVAYHDHNWGRWHWGDDIGWEWGAFAAADGTTFVLACTTNRAHTRSGPPLLVADVAGTRRVFTGPRLRLQWSGPSQSPRRRLPGALAALHTDRIAARVPQRLAIEADDGVDSIELHFTSRSTAQLILTDPSRPGASFLHELAGTFTADGRMRGIDSHVDGLAVVERLE
jgi:hypothetical protein